MLRAKPTLKKNCQQKLTFWELQGLEETNIQKGQSTSEWHFN